ncbi:ATP-binding protein [Nocardioides sp. R1-1]|uniref:ATP-binding protein n=1 Tax=Nocardioides sp. R1-1 TaxID=3383502 RepID=UPI0038CFC1DC
MVPSNFVRAVRESGYLSISTAIAELLDNALQASASEIVITITRTDANSLPEITVEDDGVGMSKKELETCLRFGGSSRFDARHSFGRFGMGLPAASLSQAKRVEVTSWQGHGDELSVALDVDLVSNGTPPALAATKVGRSRSESGTRVRWMQCDRIEYRRLAWLERALHRDLGRMYRHFISNGSRISINGKPVEPIDPLLLSAKVQGASASLAFDPLCYELETSGGDTSMVNVRFSMLPVHRWHHLDNVTKRRIGIVGHGGVSILRAGREIANGWHLMGGKRKENYDDWWRCEITFEPPLDEHFGITINKQGIRPSAELREALEPELESIARLLNSRVRQAFEDVKFQSGAEASCHIAAAADRDLPVLPKRHGRRAIGPLNYRISTTQLAPDELFATTLQSNVLDVQLNVDHPAFNALYKPLQTLADGGAEFRTALELLILSFARSAMTTPDSTDRLLAEWGTTYGRMLQKA